MYVVRDSDLTVDKVIITKNLKGCKNCECYVSKKIQKTNISGFKTEVFLFFVFFSFCFLYIHYFSFAALTIIRTTKRQRGRINKHQIPIKL